MTDTVYNETKLLGCVSRVAVRDCVRYFMDEISRRDISAGTGPFEESALGFTRDIRALICHVRTLHEKMSNPAIPVRLKECFAFFDEFFSLTIEEYLAVLLESIRKEENVRKELPSALGESGAPAPTPRMVCGGIKTPTGMAVEGGAGEGCEAVPVPDKSADAGPA